MKLLDKYSKFKELYDSNYIFDPDERIFYASDVEKFSKPVGYDEWSVEEFDVQEYGQKRLLELGITEDNNTIEWFENSKSKKGIKEKIFTINKRGDIEILIYDVDGKPLMKDKNPDEKDGKGVVKGERYCWNTRLHPWHEKLTGAKYDFSYSQNKPLFSPELITAFKKGTEVPTLVITEGQFKARKGCIEGIPTIGLGSITHFNDSNTKRIHGDIIRFIRTCKVKKIIVLWDGDCRFIWENEVKEMRDLAERPRAFMNYANKIIDQLKESELAKDVKYYFATINTHETNNNAKGLDDLFILNPNLNAKILIEFNDIGNIHGDIFLWENMNNTEKGKKELLRFFMLKLVKEFYEFHKEKIKGNNFIYNGNQYKVEKNLPVIEIPKDLKRYKRIGFDYYAIQDVPAPIGTGDNIQVVHEEKLVVWNKTAIMDDFKKRKEDNPIASVERYNGFTNIADHINYQQVINGFWNLYSDVKHQPVKGDFPHIRKLLKHLFDEQEANEMIYDYITVLYKKPYFKLPVICLTSKVQGSGKSTFVYLMKLIFKQNMSIISSVEFVSEFNSSWISSLVVAIEETLFEKKEAYEKLKDLVTRKQINRNEKNKSANEIPCMLHFIINTNHEDEFIKIDENDRRLWVRKILSKPEKIKNFQQKIEEEIPFFIDFIINRDIKYQYQGDELYFAESDFMTEAKQSLIKNSVPFYIKELRYHLEEYFSRWSDTEVMLSAKDIITHFGVTNVKPDHLNKTIPQFMKVERKVNDQGVAISTTYSIKKESTKENGAPEYIKLQGRPFVFKRSSFAHEK